MKTQHATAANRLGLRSLLISACFGLALSAEPESQGSGAVRWFLSIAHADYVSSDPGTYRVYEQVGEIPLRFTLSNTDASPLTITPAALANGVKLELSSDGVIPVSVEWQPDGWLHGTFTTFPPAASLRFTPGQGAEFRIILRRSDGEPFSAGRYTIRVSLDLSEATNDEGGRWSGRLVMGSTGVFLVVKPASTPHERIAEHRQIGRKAKDQNRLQDALMAFESAFAIDPTNVTVLIDLGIAYLDVGRFRDAIVPLEQALAKTAGGRNPVTTQLARAYLGVNNETNAVRVLRNSGMAANRIPGEIALLRKHLPKTPK